MKKQFTIFLILFFAFGLLKDAKAFVDPIPNCTRDDYICTEWSSCSNSQQSRQCSKSSNCFGDEHMPATSQTPCIITDESLYPKMISISPTTVRMGKIFEIIGENLDNAVIMPTGARISLSGNSYGEVVSWSNNKILVKVVQSNPGAVGIVSFSFRNIGGGLETFVSPHFTIKEACDWECSNWNDCSKSNLITRTCVKPDDCQSLNTPMPATTQECFYKPPCTLSDYNCTDWSSCSILYGKQTRQCGRSSSCDGSAQGSVPEPATSQSCTYVPTCSYYSWSCGSWSSCSSNNTQTRSCSKNSNCEGGTQSPETTQSCTYTPACSQDTWQCGNWGTCSPQGTQSRSCNRTYDCPSAETAAPATSQYCEAPNQPKLQTPTEDLGIVNQDSIIKSTVKLICPVSSTMASQGSGTVIDSKGTILTNKHVIDGTPGCLVGFVDNYDDEPYFGDRQIADIYKVSSDADVAVLKLRNPSNKSIASVNISQGNSSSIKLGEILTTYGYPAKFGTNITYTSGDFSGVDGNYLKTTAVIEHGNSGGGAYLKNGAFIGIPSAVIKGSLNSMGYLLSVNKVNSWLNNSVAYNNNSNNNNYSRVSAILDNIDLNALDSLGLFIAGDEKNIKTGSENQIDKNLSNRLKGKILLQVENHGEAWYVNPKDNKKYYMANGNEAYRIMRYLGVGITNKDLNKTKTDKNFAKKQSGKIFLQTESHGEAYYIDSSGATHYLKDGSAAYTIMRELGLGIKNNDLSKILEGSL